MGTKTVYFRILNQAARKEILTQKTSGRSRVNFRAVSGSHVQKIWNLNMTVTSQAKTDFLSPNSYLIKYSLYTYLFNFIWNENLSVNIILMRALCKLQKKIISLYCSYVNKSFGLSDTFIALEMGINLIGKKKHLIKVACCV